MNGIEYLGEHLLPGKLGNAAVIISFTAALLATVAYFFSTKILENGNWKKLARWSFYTHFFGVVAIIATLFYMLINQLFEYHYVWQHSNTEMPFRYILSCFWEGQEGSFLLWTFWHTILGLILIKTAKEWEASVMTIFSSVQVFLVSMLLGIYVGDQNIGSSPFNVLLREHPDFINLPLFQNESYLDNLDGRGLNPLLQNYWMTIHPPTLFLGFAATLVPFCFAFAGLWRRKYTEWLKPALPWSYFGIGVLGMGILMGGAWAYEALSFGGFWAWDPVENASLVPWLTFVGAAHVMIIHKNKGTSLITTFFLTLITFILILYSTFLTRSGILGESSVHAFTDLGLAGQLLIYLLFYLFISLGLLIWRVKEIPGNKQEDALWSREFWMLIGSLVLLISAIQISFTTSIPVINKLFGTKMAPPIDAIDHYNAWQLPIAIIVSLLIGFTQFLKYKSTDFNAFIKKLIVPAGVSVFLTVVVSYILSMSNALYIALLFSTIFAFTANLDYLLKVLKGQVKKGGASVAHIGFGLTLLGALISTSKQQNISSNTSGIDVTQLGEQFENHENILLFKGDTLQMGEHWVSYQGKRKEGVNVFYEVKYLKRISEKEYQHVFTLFPTVQTNPRMGNVSEPDTRHFWDKDIYTHITYAELDERSAVDTSGYKEPENFTVKIGDTIYSSNSIIILESFNRAVNVQELGLSPGDIAVGAQLRVITMQNKSSIAQPVYVLKDRSFTYSIPDELEDLGLKFTFHKINPEDNTIEISLAEKKSNSKEFIIMKAIVFPGINVLWIGCILMVLGTLIAVKNRISLNNNSSRKELI